MAKSPWRLRQRISLLHLKQLHNIAGRVFEPDLGTTRARDNILTTEFYAFLVQSRDFGVKIWNPNGNPVPPARHIWDSLHLREPQTPTPLRWSSLFIVPPQPSFVLEKIDLGQHRDVVLLHPLAALMQEVSRIQVGEGPKVLDEMGLIEVPAVPSQL